MKLISKAQFLQGHRTMAWLGGFAFLLFCLSGMLHPLMSWTGPKTVKFRPPQTIFSAEHLQKMPRILAREQVTHARSVQLVPGPDDVLLQVTQQPNVPRRYFNLSSQQELVDYEQTYAIWLARYFLDWDTPQAPQVRHIEFQTSFDHAYPAVNRLLPVYKVAFADQAQTTIYIYTELGVVASLTNQYKTRLQTLFRWLHTWSWLGDSTWLRFVIMLGLVSSCIAMLMSGAYLIMRFRRRQPLPVQKMHRWLGTGLLIPITFFVISGLYHLIHHQIQEPTQASVADTALKTIEPFSLTDLKIEQPISSSLEAQYASIRLIFFEQLYLRLNSVTKETNNSRQARFKGLQSEGQPVYINTQTGKVAKITEQALARYYLEQHIDQATTIEQVDLITSFGPGYDFRNKRLPVWRGTLKNGTTVFVDNATGFQIDSTSTADQLERLSFSYLHKYNFLTPWIGRFNRDIIMVIILLLTLVLAALGAWRKRSLKG